MEEANFDASQPAKIDLNKKSLPKQKTIQHFSIDASGSEKQKMKILPRGKWELPANQCRPICPWLADGPAGKW